MAFLPGLVKLVKKVARPLGKIIEGLPVVGAPFKAAQSILSPIERGVTQALKLIKKVPLPVAAGAGGLAVGAGVGELAGGGGEGMPALPGGGGGAMVPYSGGAMSMPSMSGRGALLNPQMATAIMAMSIPTASIPLKYNPPHGYVIVRVGTAVLCLPKMIARHFGLWHQARKPPISAGDWHHYQTAQRVEKKLRHLAIHALRHHARTTIKQHAGRK